LSQSQPPPLNRFSDGFHFTVTTAIILIVCQTATVTLIRFRGISDVRKLVEIEKKTFLAYTILPVYWYLSETRDLAFSFYYMSTISCAYSKKDTRHRT